MGNRLLPKLLEDMLQIRDNPLMIDLSSVNIFSFEKNQR